jgi:tetratricopeptide (TPR) repeat protein
MNIGNKHIAGIIRIAAIVFILLAVSCASTGSGLENLSEEELLLKQADVLIKMRKYESAFRLVSGYEGPNQYIHAKKIEIVSNYAIESMMHKMFAMKDLADNENLMSLRKSGGSFVMFNFDPEIYAPVIDKHPEYSYLSKMLADYYYDAYYRFRDDWVHDAETTLMLANKYYRIAREDGIYDYMTLANESHYLLTQEMNEEALELLDESVRLNPDYATNHYNKAFAYSALGKKKEAVAEAVLAYKLYEKSELKYDSIIMAAKLSMETGMLGKAEELLLTAVMEFPKASDPVYYLVYLYLKQDKVPMASELALETFKGFPSYPSVASMLLDAYAKAGVPEFYLQLIGEMEKLYTDKEILGNLIYHRCLAYIKIGDTKNARKDIVQAKKYFSSVYEKDHQVFAEIEKILQSLK